MILIKPLMAHIEELLTWISCPQEFYEWSGLHSNAPCDLLMLSKVLKVNQYSSYVLLSEQGDMLGFGQYYSLLDRCHLCRLIVNPKYRGQGIISTLMAKLTEKGLYESNQSECSVFVFPYHESAINAYHKFGFEIAQCPSEIGVANCLYMVKPAK